MLRLFTMLHHVKFSNLIPITSLLVSCCAFRYQIKVLFPWHEELSKQIFNLEIAVKMLENKINKK